jgi:hypothetical protein
MFPETTSGWFTYSMVDLMRWDAQGPQHICGPDGGFISLSTGPRIAEARNQIVDTFADKHPKAEWLLMLDDDMTFHPSLLEKLMAVAHPTEVPIVGGLCFAGGRMNDPYPTIAELVQKGDENEQYASIKWVKDYPRNALVRVGATGGACLLMHRGALGAIGNAYKLLPNGKPNPYPWFAEGVIGPEGEPWGEDVVFCLRANQLGIPVWVHTGVKLGHVKHHIIDEEYFDNYRKSVKLTAQGAFDDPPTPLQPNRAQRRAAARQKTKVA